MVQEAIAWLPERLRLVVSLHFYADLSIREMAEILEAPASTVQSRLKDALVRLKYPLKDLEV